MSVIIIMQSKFDDTPLILDFKEKNKMLYYTCLIFNLYDILLLGFFAYYYYTKIIS